MSLTPPLRAAQPLPVALDAMGGDDAPHVTIEAARLACERGLGPIALVVCADRVPQRDLLGLPPGVRVVEADEVVAMGDSPARAARAKTNSTMHVGLRLVRDGEACAFVTAGNSGAALAVGLLTLKRVEGCERPAIASLMPSLKEPVVLLDMGANVDCRASHLAQFALMGATYARLVLGRERPRVGLLSNGQEPSKGTEPLREAHRALTQVDLNYLGFVEGRDLPMGVCDVVVTDGFVGNVALKLSEGVVEALLTRVRQSLEARWWTRLLGALLRAPLRALRAELDWRRIGGAPILGLRGTAVISHGSADAEAICAAIERAREYAAQDLPGQVAAALERSPLASSLSTTAELLTTPLPDSPRRTSSAIDL